MRSSNAGKSGSFRIGGHVEVHRLGFGAAVDVVLADEEFSVLDREGRSVRG
jgi:hypothetical protein